MAGVERMRNMMRRLGSVGSVLLVGCFYDPSGAAPQKTENSTETSTGGALGSTGHLSTDATDLSDATASPTGTTDPTNATASTTGLDATDTDEGGSTSSTGSTSGESGISSSSGTSDPRSCGDGKVDPGEGCDDGNADNSDACLDSCEPASCGDGFLQQDIELCDLGAENGSYDGGCSATCDGPAASCGDGEWNKGYEECDGRDVAQHADCSPGCELDCHLGWDDCNVDPADGCEANLNTVENCGTCDHTCPGAGNACQLYVNCKF